MLKYKTTDIDKIPQVKHGFFTRLGGVGAGLYDSLNCAWSAHDTPENTAENRARVARALDIKPENFVTVTQIHSANVVMVTAPWGAKDAPKADGLVTKTPGIAIGILTADCAPVLFSSKDGTVIGAAHAGWKGAVGGVLEATVAAMRDLGAKAEDIVAAVGPCIGPLSYEVDTAFEAPFLAQDAANERFFTKQNEDKYLFDLPGYVTHRLKLAGVNTVYDTHEDTLADEKSYFSYRRSCQQREADYGRQASVIAIS